MFSLFKKLALTISCLILNPTITFAHDLKIAVIDTGVNLDHTDFKPFLIYDKKDGLQAFDFITSQRKTVDTDGHGTNVASLIILGNTVKFKLIPLRFTDGNDQKDNMIRDMQNFNKALKMAIGLEVDVINISSTHGLARNSELELFKEAQNKKILVLVAAGNQGLDLNKADMLDKPYPCMYDLPNVVCVGNWDPTKHTRIPSSNYNGRVNNYVDGNNKVGLGKSGASLMDSLNIMSGSSQATALLSRWVLWQKSQGKTYEQILELLHKQKVISKIP